MHVIDVRNLQVSETCITNTHELAGLSTCFYLDSEHMKRRLYEKEINKMIRNGLFSLLCLHLQICDCHLPHLWPKDIKLMHQGQILMPAHKSG